MSTAFDRFENEELDGAVRERVESLGDRGGSAALREFAIWCALQVVSVHPFAGSTIAAVHEAAKDKSGKALDQFVEDGYAAAGVAVEVGRLLNPAAACARLASLQCGFPDARQAALLVSALVRECFGYLALKEQGDHDDADEEAFEAAASAVGCQIDQLDRMLAEFDGPRCPKGSTN